jgi:hypothetical protein
MNAVTSTWRQLVRRKLWPVAVLLVAALAAVPVVLARDAAAPVVPASPVPAGSAKADDTIAEPVVASVAADKRSRRRRVLGDAKDPFKPAPPKKVKADASQTEQLPKVDVPSTDSGGSTDTGTGGTTPAEPAPEKKYFKAGTIIVRFGTADEGSTLTRFAIAKMAAVPDEELPLLVYMGLTKDGKKAKFLVDAAVEVDGDGVCRPHRSSCETIELGVGETEFLDVLNPEYDETDPEMTEDQKYSEHFQLDLVDIKRAGDDDVK